jgi:hypothetical protein
MKNLLIASSKLVPEINWTDFCRMVMECAQFDHQVEVSMMEAVSGPGCVNYAMKVSGTDENLEKFANSLTMALMPSRWCFTESTPTGGWKLSKEYAS